MEKADSISIQGYIFSYVRRAPKSFNFLTKREQISKQRSTQKTCNIAREGEIFNKNGVPEIVLHSYKEESHFRRKGNTQHEMFIILLER